MRRKLNAMPVVFAGRSVLLVDDSIVRGTTMSQIVDMVRRAGASKVTRKIMICQVTTAFPAVGHAVVLTACAISQGYRSRPLTVWGSSTCSQICLWLMNSSSCSCVLWIEEISEYPPSISLLQGKHFQ